MDLNNLSVFAAANQNIKYQTERQKVLAANVANAYKVYTPKPSTALTIDGNGVVLEDQMNEISKSKGEYDRVITLYGKYQNMLNTANTKISG